MSKIRKVCVYCGSGAGTDPAFVEAARAFGETLAKNGIGLVYGGGAVGMMGAVAHSVLDHGGELTGIIPDFLMSRERALRGTHEMIVTRSMHERKHLLFDHSDAFVALPGGIGTLEELVEQLTWVQLGRHQKPIVIVNVNRFWDPLIDLLDHMQTLGFIHSERLLNYLIVERIEDVLPAILQYAISKKIAEVETPPAPIERL